MTSDDTFDVPANVAARRVGEETVILNLDSGTYFSLNEVGSRVWELAAEGHSIAAMCDAMTEEFDVERDVLEQDVVALVDDLLAQGLIARA